MLLIFDKPPSMEKHGFFFDLGDPPQSCSYSRRLRLFSEILEYDPHIRIATLRCVLEHKTRVDIRQRYT
ncbi:Uncharacterised protein [Yersinia aleksiciae]|nr:Uncharacterised protein [Yersinia aleksiciae]